GLLALGELEDFGLLLAALAPPQVHAHQHLHSLLGVHTAQSDCDRHDRVRPIVRSIETQLELELVDFLDKLGGFALGFVNNALVFFERSQLDQLERVAGATLHRQPWLELFAHRGQVAHDLLRNRLISPQIWGWGLLLELVQTCLFSWRVKDARAAWRCGCGGPEASRWGV